MDILGATSTRNSKDLQDFQEDADFVMRALSKYHGRNHIIRELCKRGYAWEEAARFVDRIESECHDEIENRQQLLGKILIGLFTVLSLAAGVAALAAIRLPTAVASPGWPIVDGVVIHSLLMETGTSTNEGWYPQVSYRYSVEGTAYVSQNIEVLVVANGSTSYYAEKVLKRYPLGKQVEVHYNPRNPAMSVLEPGIPDNGVFTPLLFFAGGGIGLFLLSVSLLGVLNLVGTIRLPQ